MQLSVSRLGRAALATLLLTTAVFILSVGHTLAQPGKKSDAEVKVHAATTKPDAGGKQVITVTIDVNKGWYIYANPVDHEDLEPVKTVVTVAGKVKPADVKVHYPPGTPVKDAAGNYKIYQDTVAIQAQVQRAAGDIGPLEVTVKVNACNKKGSFCLPAGQVKVTVP